MITTAVIMIAAAAAAAGILMKRMLLARCSSTPCFTNRRRTIHQTSHCYECHCFLLDQHDDE